LLTSDGNFPVGSKIHTKKEGTNINFIAILEKLNSVVDAETEVYKKLLRIQFIVT